MWLKLFCVTKADHYFKRGRSAKYYIYNNKKASLNSSVSFNKSACMRGIILGKMS